jgi:hypothetical protein
MQDIISKGRIFKMPHVLSKTTYMQQLALTTHIHIKFISPVKKDIIKL